MIRVGYLGFPLLYSHFSTTVSILSMLNLKKYGDDGHLFHIHG